jgi:hypothetical protein
VQADSPAQLRSRNRQLELYGERIGAKPVLFFGVSPPELVVAAVLVKILAQELNCRVPIERK